MDQSQSFDFHFAAYRSYMQGANAILAHAREHGWAIALDRGFRAQWAAMMSLAITSVDCMRMFAHEDLHRDILVRIDEETYQELHDAFAAHKAVLDYSLPDCAV